MQFNERLKELKSWWLSADANHEFPEASHTWYWARLGIIVVILALMTILLWGFLAPLHGAVVGHGQVKVENYRQVVQHQEGGIVRSILVQNGSVVKKGQPLILLEDLRTDANYDITIHQYWSELARNARLVAERSFLKEPEFPQEIVFKGKDDVKVAEVLAKELSLFQQRRQTVNFQIKLLNQQIRETEAEITATSAQLDADRSARNLMQEELAANRLLLDKGFISNTRLLGLARNLTDYDSRVGEHGADLARARQKLTDLKLRVETVRNEYQKTAATELKESSDKLNEIQQRAIPLTDIAQRLQIVAPADGIVVDLRVHTIGATIAPREPLMDIVPADQKLVVEAKLPLESISELRIGMNAEVRLTAYKQRTTPLVKGNVTYISADALADKERPGESYYLCQIVLDPESVKEAGIQSLLPGMPADVFIQTKARTAIKYLIDPVLDSMNRSFNEK
jgi:HlyD family type I secretion membrane fusion protein